MAGNILGQGIKGLEDLKSTLDAYEKQKQKLSLVSADVKDLQKELNNAEKDLQNEIDSVIKKKRADICNAYDPEINKQQEKLKKAKNQRNKAKTKGVKERISIETAELRAENKNLNDDIKDIVKVNGIPKICNHSWYYTLFMPKGIGEYLKILLFMLIFVVGLPALVYFLVLPQDWHNTVVLVITYIVIVFIEFVIYKTISDKTEIPYNIPLSQARAYRTAIVKNNKQIKKLKRKIKKDKDEGQYGLSDFDEEITACESIIQAQTRKKEEALNYFEKNTKPEETKKISDKAMGKINKIKDNLSKKTNEENEAKRLVNATQSTLSVDYEPYLGKDMMTSSRLSELITLMKSKKIATVSEALTVYKNK